MILKNLEKWNVRASMAYAIGVWTVIGSCGYYRFFRKEKEDKPQNTEDEELLVDKFSTEEQEGKPKGFQSQTTVVYKENFVPYSTRLFNYLKTLNGGPESTVESD
ncbi:small integral membrane protein 26-like [Anguilla rostrata]